MRTLSLLALSILIPLAGCTSRNLEACVCTELFDPVCGSNHKTYGNGCFATCAGVTIAHTGECDPGDLGGSHNLARQDGGGNTGAACKGDIDCVWRDSGCCGVCSNRTDTVPPPIGCGQACFEPPSCLCVMGHCAKGNLGGNASCDPNRDRCGEGLKCCATCCGVPPAGDMSLNPDPRCITPTFGPQGAMCPPIA